MRHIYRITDGCEVFYYSAENANHAFHLADEDYDFTENLSGLEDYEIMEMDDSMLLKVYTDYPFDPPTPYIEKTCMEWAEGEEGCISTTLY